MSASAKYRCQIVMRYSGEEMSSTGEGGVVSARTVPDALGGMMMRQNSRPSRSRHQVQHNTAKAIRQLTTEIVAARDCGRVIVSIEDRTDEDAQIRSPEEIADQLMRSLRCTALGEGWISVTEQDARTIAHHLLTKDLAYRADIMPSVHAHALIDRFLAFFPGDRWYRTNGTPVPRSDRKSLTPESFGNGWGWNSLTDATFDLGVVVISLTRVGALLVADED